MKKQIKYGGSLAGFPEWWAGVKSLTKSIWTGNWQTGPETKKFEAELAEDVGVKYAVMTSSGSCAGLLALAALELPEGSEVIIPAVTFPTIFNIILQCNLVPVVVDCELYTNNIDLDKLESAISKKTKAIIAVHILGNPIHMPDLMHIARKHKLKVIEDNCDGYGSTIESPLECKPDCRLRGVEIHNHFENKMVGSFGDISFTSTHAAHIITTGVGGVVFTNDEDLMEKVRMYRDWGRQANTTKPNTHKKLPVDYNPRFIYEKIGWNFQILELQSAIGRVQLRKAKKIKELRQRNARYLGDNIKQLSPYHFTKAGHDICWFAFPMISDNRAKLVKHLEKHGIETRSLMSGNITRHPAYAKSKYRIGNKLTESDMILEKSFWISCHPSLKQKDLDYIIETLYAFTP